MFDNLYFAPVNSNYGAQQQSKHHWTLISRQTGLTRSSETQLKTDQETARRFSIQRVFRLQCGTKTASALCVLHCDRCVPCSADIFKLHSSHRAWRHGLSPREQPRLIVFAGRLRQAKTLARTQASRLAWRRMRFLVQSDQVHIFSLSLPIMLRR
jgi:hypothetical protein